MATAQEAYEKLAQRWERIRLEIIEASQQADRLMVPIPQALARADADILCFPAQIREVDARRAGTWTGPLERADEDPDRKDS